MTETILITGSNRGIGLELAHQYAAQGWQVLAWKAALNAVMKSAAIDLAPKGVKVAILNPGWVQTDMGGPNAEITVAESVGRMREILGTITPENSGTFFDIDGSIIPW